MSTLAALVAIACSNDGATSESGARPDLPGAAAPVGNTGGPKAQSACELLTPGDIAGFLEVPDVKKDDLNSGKNDFTGVDICNWYVKEGGNQGIEVRFRRAASHDEGALALVFNSAKNEAVEHDVARIQKLQPVGVGDEGVYGPYSVGPGGSIVVRVGPTVATMTGSVSKETLVAMATLAAKRM